MAERDQLDQALIVWRMGERFLQWQPSPGLREDYEHAIALGLAHLQRSTTLDALLADYAAHHGVDETDDRWENACRDAAPGSRLNSGIVEDAAYWRRARQLLGHEEI